MRAAAGGSLESLVYAHENGCKWNQTTCSNAAKNGHLTVLKYTLSLLSSLFSSIPRFSGLNLFISGTRMRMDVRGFKILLKLQRLKDI